jgi:hypothetical protein
MKNSLSRDDRKQICLRWRTAHENVVVVGSSFLTCYGSLQNAAGPVRAAIIPDAWSPSVELCGLVTLPEPSSFCISRFFGLVTSIPVYMLNR